MSVQSLPQQLLRELRRNPKKAGLLALLAGVAFWFWAPLLTGWFKGAEAGGAEAEQATPAAVTPVSAPPSEAKAGEAAKVAGTASQNWQQLVRWMDQDSRRKADELPLERNPFAPRKSPPKPAAESAKSATPLPDNLDKLGLKLTGTLLGPEKRLALINGRTYAEGQTIKVSADVSFVVRQVEERKVTLERGGKVLVLQVAKPGENEPSQISRKER